MFRNGMVHGYLPKEASQIAMLDSPETPCGVLRVGDVYVFVVQRYFVDFVVAAAQLHVELVGHRHPLIHMWAPHKLDPRMGAS